jgi:two-component system nitrate/nitrite response regulator NarL
MKIVICDDHRLFADSLGALLSVRGHEIVALADRPAEAVRIVESREVATCVMDLSFRDEPIDVALEVIRQLGSQVEVIVLTGHDDDHHRRACLEAGAAAFASKSTCGDDLVSLIEGGIDSADGNAGPRTEQAGRGASVYFLTEREREVLDSLAEGHSTAIIAERLGVRAATARSHVQSVLMKLGVHSRVAAVAFAVERGLVDVA